MKKATLFGNHQYELGLYTKDTRFLNSLKLFVNGQSPIALHLMVVKIIARVSYSQILIRKMKKV
jgi:hypothetical protein